ncbi:MAG: saccharopine dehydrogenase NADP-binding domain-containing protein [Bacteroidia bacterium]|nr:saccharopine dehydrogenase NADP-binding domain-containing protein [Bacteroidia bacterium]
MKTITVLGSGMVGSVIAQDLANSYRVIVADKSEASLQKLKHKKNIETIATDVTNHQNLKNIVKDAHLVITALPGFMAFNVLKQIIEMGKNVADISFYPEDALSLNELAQKNKCTVIVDCGVAPGMSNFLLGYHASKMQVEEFVCYVGGLPVERKFPYEYKAPFSPVDVIEEYTRPARMKENNKIIVKPALSELEMIDFEGVGTLEAFNTDGLRSLLYTMNVPNMKEKTLRYPGHVRLIQALQATGFFDTSEIDINDTKIKPIDVTTHLLKNIWKLHPQDEEFTVMRVMIKGKENHQQVTYTYDLLDRYDKNTGFSSMSRTTGFTCTAMAHLILENKFNKIGVFPPELIADDEKIFNDVMNHLEMRNVKYHRSKN